MGPVPFTLNTLDLIVLGVFRTLFFMLFSDEAGGCAAVREAFILSLSHCRGGREGRRWRFLLADTSGDLLYLCWFDNLCYCFYVISFILVYQNPEMAGQKIRCVVEV